MKKPGFKFFILQRLARQLRSWANLASRLSGLEDQLSFSVTTDEPSTLVKENTDTARPPAHWLARVEARRQPPHWFSHVSTNRPVIQKEQNKHKSQSQKEYSNQASGIPSRSTPPDGEERTDAQGAMNRQATITSANSTAEIIVMNRHTSITERDIMQRWEQGVVPAPINQPNISSTSTPSYGPSSPTTPDSSLWQEKATLPVIPEIEHSPILQDQRAALVSTFRLQSQISEPMQTALPGSSFPGDTTHNRTIVSRDQVVEPPDNRERVILQDVTIQKDKVHRGQQKGMPEQISQPEQLSPLPPDAWQTQAVQTDPPSRDARTNRRALLGEQPAHQAQGRMVESVSLSPAQDQAATSQQANMLWPSLPEDSMFNVTSDSQDLTLLRRIWERQQRLNEEQRGNLWNA